MTLPPTEARRPDEEIYPGIELAYPWAFSAYQWAIQRWDAIDGRI